MGHSLASRLPAPVDDVFAEDVTHDPITDEWVRTVPDAELAERYWHVAYGFGMAKGLSESDYSFADFYRARFARLSGDVRLGWQAFRAQRVAVRTR